MKRLLSSLLLLAVMQPVVAQSDSQTTSKAGSMMPASPRRGGELRLRYSPLVAGARLRAGDEIYGAATFITEQGSRNLHVRLSAVDDGSLTGVLRVPDDAVYAYARFLTRSDHDRGADVEAMVHDQAGAPVRGARLRTVFGPGADMTAIIEAELQAHPGNFAAYRTKWFFSRFTVTPAELLATVRGDLLTIGEAGTASALWARSYGAMLLADEPRARALVIRALHDYPQQFAAARALGDYEYQAYEQQITGVGARLLARRKGEVVAAHPETWLARQEIRELSSDEDFPLAATRAVCRAWMRDEPLHPEPRLALAVACLEHGVDLEQASVWIGSAINRYLNGDLRLAGDPSAMMTTYLLPHAYRVAARIAMARDNHGEALSCALASQKVETRTSADGHEIEARVWQRLGSRARAEAAWVQAMKRGSTIARKELEASYRAAHDDTIGFEDHLAKLLDKSGAGARPVAPTFAGVDLDGGAFALSELQGRVVVLNFWGLGCAPCKVEIPDLSRLADGFAGAEVEFLAFAGDPADSLRSYLADHPFSYRVVAEAGRTVQRYRVTSWPTHVLIDKRGRIAATLVGGGKGQDERLRVMIERLLAE